MRGEGREGGPSSARSHESARSLRSVGKRLATVIASFLFAVLVPAAAFPTRVIDPAPPPLSPPLVGFSFSPESLPAGAIPEESLARLLIALQPDLVRLPVYWGAVAPTEPTLDYAAVDRLIETIEAQDRKSTRL